MSEVIEVLEKVIDGESPRALFNYYSCLEQGLSDAEARAAYEEADGDGDSKLLAHARRELELAGLLDAKDDDGEDDMMQKSVNTQVLAMLKLLSDGGHSGFSASYAINLFMRLASFKPLSELTSRPEEWNDVSEMAAEDKLWQSVRDSEAFSHDGGKTFYRLSETEDTVQCDSCRVTYTQHHPADIEDKCECGGSHHVIVLGKTKDQAMHTAADPR